MAFIPGAFYFFGDFLSFEASRSKSSAISVAFSASISIVFFGGLLSLSIVCPRDLRVCKSFTPPDPELTSPSPQTSLTKPLEVCSRAEVPKSKSSLIRRSLLDLLPLFCFIECEFSFSEEIWVFLLGENDYNSGFSAFSEKLDCACVSSCKTLSFSLIILLLSI